MAKGETVKYIIDADTSGFARGMAEAALESDVAGKQIDRNLSKTAKSSENNFKDIRKNAQTAASQIRNFGIAFQAFNTTSAIIGVTALSGAIIELSGAIAAAGSTFSILPGIVTQAAAGFLTFKTGTFGLSDAFKAINKNDPKAFAAALGNLGPAATQVAYAFGGLNKAFNSVRLNTQQALLSGLGDAMLRLGAIILPTINAGMQIVGRAINGVLKSAIGLAETPLFQGLVATIFSDTAKNVTILSGALGPLLTIFTDLYLITRPYITLLAQSFVTLTKNAAAYLSSAKGQLGLNIAIQEGIIALELLGSLVSSVFGLLTSLFRTSVNAGNSLIPTLIGIIKSMEAWVNSAKGQSQLIALFNFTSLALQSVAASIGRALTFFFEMVSIVNSLNPTLQKLIVNFLGTALTLRPLLAYLSQLYLAIRVLGVTIFNFGEQILGVFAILGAAASIVLILGAALIILGAIIRGPLGGALIIIGSAIAAYIGLSYLASLASETAAAAFFEEGVAALIAAEEESILADVSILVATTMYNTAAAAADAGAGMSFAASAASFLSTALLAIVIAAAGVVLILSMLGVFGGGTKKAASATTGFSSSLGGLQKAMKGVNTTGINTSNNGLSALNDSLGSVGQTADTTTDSLASFDKMNVLTDNNANANAGIPGLPSLPNLGTPSLGAPTLDTGDFDKAIKDMQKNFDGLQKNLGKPLVNPFDAIGKWIDSHPWISLAAFSAILAIIAGLFIFVGAAALGVSFTLALIVGAVVLVIAIGILLWKNWDNIGSGIQKVIIGVIAVIGLIVAPLLAIIAIGILLWQNWDAVWAGIKAGAAATWQFIQGVWDDILDAGTLMLSLLLIPFQVTWLAIQAIWSVAVSFFQAEWNGIVGVFNGAVSFFSNVFSGAWNGIKSAFSAVGGFFQGIWNTIVSIFSGVGTVIGNAVSGAFKSVVNTAISWIADMINGVINAINGAISIIDKIPRVNIGKIATISLPRLATGGVITSPTIAQIGENGAEAVMPLENNTEWIDKLADKINTTNNADPNSDNTHLPSRLDAPQQGHNITIQVSGVFATSVAEQRKVADLIAKRINESVKTAGAF